MALPQICNDGRKRLLAMLRSSTPPRRAQLCMAEQRRKRAASTVQGALSIYDVAPRSYRQYAVSGSRAAALEHDLEYREAPLLEERLGLRRQQILHIDRRHAVGRAGEDRYRINDGRV